MSRSRFGDIHFTGCLIRFRPWSKAVPNRREEDTNLGWFFIIGVTVWLVFLIRVAISKYGHLRLGNDDDRPAYSNLAWFAMLFAGGIGTVLMFWLVAEPI